MAESTNELSHPKSIKLPPAVEVFANLKNAQNFAIDIGEFCWFFILLSIFNARFEMRILFRLFDAMRLYFFTLFYHFIICYYNAD